MAKRPVVIGVVVVALAALGGGIYLNRGGKKADEPPATTEEKKQKLERKDAPESGEGGGGQDLNVLMDDDREGKLVLEGIVVNRDGLPVAGATVTASTNPPRTIKSGDDGTFSFDKLVGRPYTLVARAPDGVAGPVTARLTEKSDPITLRLMPAASVEVTVVTAADKKPIAGATVELRDLETISGTTDADGKVLLASVAPGQYSLVAWAPGHAKAYSGVGVARQSGDSPVIEREQIELRAGAPVAGRVIDSAGKGVAGALVTYQGTSRWGVSADPRRDAVTSDKDGAYRFEAMPTGTFRFDARHKDYAPGSTAQIVLDGQSEKTGVDITMETGGTIAGRVQSKAGAPVGYAAVRVAAKIGGMFSRDDARQTFTDAAGNFELTGLPRRPMDVVALHETGASETVVADLTSGDRKDLIVTLDLDGTISGVVVDSAGEPVAEASVFAFPDFRKGSGDRGEWRLRGRAEELTDAGGRFTLRGLRPGPYMLRANRPGVPDQRGWLREPTSADVGDSNVKIVLPADGGVKGKVVLAGGSAAPSMFTVGFGMGGSTPFSSTDGSFQLDDIPPGEYSLQISGPEFDRKAVAIKVEADKVTDAGTITVAKGREVTGRVLDASGQPVAGAVVYCGRRVMGDGSKPSTRGFGPGGGGTKTATSDEEGAYTVYGVGPRDLALIADHETLGRSTTVAVGPGTEKVTIDLTLQPFGALEGVVTKNGAPLEGVMVNVTSKSVSSTNFGVASGPDGAYRFDRLAPDSYQVSAVPGRGMMRGMTFHSKTGIVKSGETAKVFLTVDEGGGILNVTTVKKDGSGPVNFTIYRTASFPITSTVAKALDQEIAAHDGGAFSWVPGIGGRGKLENLLAGIWTICAIPLPAEVTGMSGTMQYLEREGDNLPVVCVQKQIVDGEQSLEIAVDLPPFVPEPQGT